MLEGDLDNGELEVGQAVGLIKTIPTVQEVFQEILSGYSAALKKLP
jgi:enoyl-[acyl-carrier protein] reductase II